MYENTILNSLRQYHIHIQSEKGLNNIKQDNSLLNRIIACEEYIEQGNEVTTNWLKENHTVVSKAVKYAHDFIHQNYIESDSEDSSTEHKELNLCERFFTGFYEKLGVDSKYMDIDF